MKIGDSIGNHYRIRIGNGGPGNGLPAGTEAGGQRGHGPTVAVGGGGSTASLSSMLWLSLADRLESDKDGAPLATSVADEFMEWAEMSYAEKIQAQILKEKGLTQEDLAAMDAEQRAEIVEEIENAIQRQLELEVTKDKASTTTTG